MFLRYYKVTWKGLLHFSYIESGKRDGPFELGKVAAASKHGRFKEKDWRINSFGKTFLIWQVWLFYRDR